MRFSNKADASEKRNCKQKKYIFNKIMSSLAKHKASMWVEAAKSRMKSKLYQVKTKI